MRGCLIINPHAGSGEEASILEEAVGALDDFTLLRSEEPGDARRLAMDLGEDCGLVVAAGGDGTLHEVINGLFDRETGKVRAAVGLVPLGTGNDFARTICIPDDPLIAFELARKGSRRALDLIDIEGAAIGSSVAVNLCSGGLAPHVDEQVTEEMKETWGPLSYLVGTAKSLTEAEGFQARLIFDDGSEVEMNALSIVVANGRTAGGGHPAAPRADPEDGLLDVVVVPHMEDGQIGALVAVAVAGDYLDHPEILFRRTRRVQVESTPAMWFNADGERVVATPTAFTALKGALTMVVGASYARRSSASR